MNFKEMLYEQLFETTSGKILLGSLCVLLFILTFGIGYFCIGLFLAIHSMKKDDPTSEAYLGLIFIWPIAIILNLVDE